MVIILNGFLMKKILTISALFLCTLSNAELIEFNDGLQIYSESISVLKNPKRVNLSFRTEGEDPRYPGAYVVNNITVFCSNQTTKFNYMNIYSSNDDYIRSVQLAGTAINTPFDIPRNSLPDAIYGVYCKK